MGKSVWMKKNWLNLSTNNLFYSFNSVDSCSLMARKFRRVVTRMLATEVERTLIERMTRINLGLDYEIFVREYYPEFANKRMNWYINT